MATDWLTGLVREIPDYPEPGATFRDITPLLADPSAFARAVDELVERFAGSDVSRVIGVEARGFIVAAPVALGLRAGFAPVRRAGRLPWAVAREELHLGAQMGEKLEVHRDAVRPGERVVVIDDVLATGATAAATCRLVEALDGIVVGLGFLIELSDLGGREQLSGRRLEMLATL
jgi:adenine phosphoribosyltransferase